MRRIDQIIWHCTATPEGREVTVHDVRRWHVADRGWSDIGYHFLIELDGTVRVGRPLGRAGAHVRGRNRHSVGIAYVGGVCAAMRPKDTRTPAQRNALYAVTQDMLRLFPRAGVHGHNEFAARACPSFDVAADWAAHLAAQAMRAAPNLPPHAMATRDAA